MDNTANVLEIDAIHVWYPCQDIDNSTKGKGGKRSLATRSRRNQTQRSVSFLPRAA